MADLAAYRVIQEALTNTMRHAPGAAARVRVQVRGNMLELVASDDGDRRQDGAAPAGAGRGLVGMRERLALVGGRLLAADHSGTGFLVHALIPTHDASPGAPEPLT